MFNGLTGGMRGAATHVFVCREKFFTKFLLFAFGKCEEEMRDAGDGGTICKGGLGFG